MFDQRLDSDIVVSTDSSQIGIGARTLGKKFLVSLVGRGGVLRDRRLNTFYGEPMCCENCQLRITE